jgi:hypothetical protein
MWGARGIIRLLLFHSAPIDFLVRRAVRGRPGVADSAVANFGSDIRDAKAWRHWIENGHIGGLPEELTRMIHADELGELVLRTRVIRL